MHNGKRSRVYVGTCVYDEDCRVAIKVMDSKDVETHNEIRMMKLLRLSGNVVTYLASEEFSDSTYMLMPAADGTLAKYISGLGKAGRREMPLDDSLPILIDLLRGIRDLNEMHVVHCALTEEKVLLKEGRVHSLQRGSCPGMFHVWNAGQRAFDRVTKLQRAALGHVRIGRTLRQPRSCHHRRLSCSECVCAGRARARALPRLSDRVCACRQGGALPFGCLHRLGARSVCPTRFMHRPSPVVGVVSAASHL